MPNLNNNREQINFKKLTETIALWDNNKKSNICVIRVPEKKGKNKNVGL